MSQGRARAHTHTHTTTWELQDVRRGAAVCSEHSAALHTLCLKNKAIQLIDYQFQTLELRSKRRRWTVTIPSLAIGLTLEKLLQGYDREKTQKKNV